MDGLLFLSIQKRRRKKRLEKREGGGANRKNLFGMRPKRKALVLENARFGKYHGVG